MQIPMKGSGSSAPDREPMKANTALWWGIGVSFVITVAIALLGWRLEAIRLLPDQGVAWYYWQLPEPTFWSKLTSWGFYIAHQLAIWYLIYRAQQERPKYTGGLHWFNIWALVVNGFFGVLHVVQTHLFYDGLAQDVSIFSSQGSVIVLLVLILIMENPRRGMFWGKKAPLSKQVVDFVRKYHGYFFAWAIIYTFWYHPAIATAGHLLGFFYTYLLMLQGSLFFTRAHLNKWWTFTLEFLVLVHGAIVAVLQGNGIWPMFAFGFGGILIITQMHGLGLKNWTKWVILGLYCAAVLWVYSDRGWAKLNEIIRIPLIDYVLVFALTGLIWLGLWVAGRVNPKLRSA
ncbi:MAG: hypothetical protein SFU83_20050 [Meiothermus sp.]|nr:hypothetical protein [Meiothermus sp.]